MSMNPAYFAPDRRDAKRLARQAVKNSLDDVQLQAEDLSLFNTSYWVTVVQELVAEIRRYRATQEFSPMIGEMTFEKAAALLEGAAKEAEAEYDNTKDGYWYWQELKAAAEFIRSKT